MPLDNSETSAEAAAASAVAAAASAATVSNLFGITPLAYAALGNGTTPDDAAIELARMELALEEVNTDRAFETTRSDFLYSIAGYLLLLNGRLPPHAFDDVEFRNFLLSLIRIYFQGSIPKSMADAVALFYTGEIQVSENFLLLQNGASGYDISDQFGFQIDVITGGIFPPDVFLLDSGTRILLDIIRPAHTLFRIRYIFTDKYLPNDTIGHILDASRWHLASYFYEDFRRYQGGIRDRDRLGVKVNQAIEDEDHSSDF